MILTTRQYNSALTFVKYHTPQRHILIDLLETCVKLALKEGGKLDVHDEEFSACIVKMSEAQETAMKRNFYGQRRG